MTTAFQPGAFQGDAFQVGATAGGGGPVDTPITPSTGSLTLTGVAPGRVVGTIITPTVGSLTLAGIASAVVQGTIITPTVGSLTLAGVASAVVQGTIITPTVGSLTLTGIAPTVVQSTVITPTVGSLTLTGVASVLVVESIRAPPEGQLTLSGVASDVVQSAVSAPSVGSLTLVGVEPIVAITAVPDVGSLTLSGVTPELIAGTCITPATGSLVLAGVAPEVTVQVYYVPSTGSLTLTGVAPTTDLGSISVTPAVGSLVLTGVPPVIPVVITPTVGSLTTVGVAPDLRRGNVVAPPQANALLSPTLTGAAPTVLSNVIMPGTGTLRVLGRRPASGNRYWVGGTADWNATPGTKWAATSGGAGGESVPNITDNVYFDANSGTVTVTVTANGVAFAQDIDFTGFTGTITSGFTLEIYGSLTLGASMTFSGLGLRFLATNLGHQITCSGKQTVSMAFDGNGGGWTFMDAANFGSSGPIQQGGTVDFNGQTITAGVLQWTSVYSAPSNMYLRNSNITLSGTTPLTLTASFAGSVFDAGTSTITCTGVNTFTGNGKTFYNVVLSSSQQFITWSIGNNVFNNLTITPTAGQAVVFSGGSAVQTINGTLTVTGSASNTRVKLTTNNTATVNMLRAAAVSLTDVDFAYITAAGAAAPFSGTRLGDHHWNLGVTFTAAATKYWVGGTGNFSDATNHWATASGGAPGAANYPLGQDDVVWDAASNTTAYTVTFSTSAADGAWVNSLSFSAPPSVSGTITWAGTAQAYIGGNLLLLSGMTRTYTGTLGFNSLTTGRTVTCNGVVLASNVTFDNTIGGGGWILQDALNIGTGNLIHNRGFLDTNGVAITANSLNSNSGAPRELRLGASTLTFQGGPSFAQNGMIFDAGTSLIYLDNTNSTSFTGVGLKFYDVRIRAAGTKTVTGPNTYRNLTLDNGTSPWEVMFNSDQFVTGTFTSTGSSASNRHVVRSDTFGGTREIMAAAVSLTDTDFQDIAAIDGPVIPWTGTRLGDLKGNSGITFTAGTNKYWVGNTSTWNAANVWATSSGGAGATANFPLAQDTCIFDGNSFSANGQTVTLTATAPHIGSMDWSGLVETGITLASAAVWIYGDVILDPNMSITGSSMLQLAGRNTQTWTSAGASMAMQLAVNSLGGTVVLQDAATIGSGFTHVRGTLDLNGQVLTALWYSRSGDIARGVASSVAGGKIATTDTTASTAWDNNAGSWTGSNLDNWSIEIGGNTTNTRTFRSSGHTYPALTFTNTTANGRMDITGSNTFKSITVSTPPQSVMFTAGTTTTIQNDNGFPSGTSGNLVTIGSITAANHNLVKSGGGRILSRYLSISRSQATPSTATWYAGGSTDGGNNSGWIFTEAILPSVGSLVLTGTAPVILYPTYITAAVGALTLTGEIPQLSLGSISAPLVGTLTLNGLAPYWDYTLTPTQGSLIFTGVAPYWGLTASPVAGSLVLTGGIPGVGGDFFVYPAVGALTLTGVAPYLGLGINPTAGSLTLAGIAPYLDRGIYTASGTLALTGVAPRWDYTLTPTPGVLTLTGAAPYWGYTLTPTPGALVLAGVTPTAFVSSILIPGVGTLVLTGLTPEQIISSLIYPSGVYAIGRIGMPLIWGRIDEGQTPGWGYIVPGQTPTWGTVSTSQTPVWVPVDKGD